MLFGRPLKLRFIFDLSTHPISLKPGGCILISPGSAKLNSIDWPANQSCCKILAPALERFSPEPQMEAPLLNQAEESRGPAHRPPNAPSTPAESDETVLVPAAACCLSSP